MIDTLRAVTRLHRCSAARLELLSMRRLSRKCDASVLLTAASETNRRDVKN